MKFLILNLLAICFSNTYAAKFAIVTAQKAVVYADYKLSSPIGYIAKGKKFRVGESPKYRGRSLPLVINGKVAYVAIKDIETSYDLGQLKNMQEKSGNSKKEEFLSRFSFNYAIQSATFFNSQAFGDTQEEQLNLSGPLIRGHILNADKSGESQMDFSMLTGSNGDLSLGIIALSPSYMLNLTYKERFKSFLGVGINLMPYVEFEYKNYFTLNGNGYGAFAAWDMRYLIKKNWEVIFNLSYQYNMLTNIKIPKDFYVTEFKPLLTGLQTSVGFVYLF